MPPDSVRRHKNQMVKRSASVTISSGGARRPAFFSQSTFAGTCSTPAHSDLLISFALRPAE